MKKMEEKGMVIYFFPSDDNIAEIAVKTTIIIKIMN